jgi:glycosyltransferase involved in cell wall biosynthesis
MSCTARTRQLVVTRLPHPISVIVPTLATAARAPYLERAIGSALAQQHLGGSPIVVVNGGNVDAELVAWLRRRRDIRLIERESADLSAALAAGCRAVDTAFFAELDDDDLLLPHALFTRWQRACDDDLIDAVVTNGIVRTPRGDMPCIADVAALRRDPLRMLLNKSWLLPGAVLYRTGRIPPELFAELPQFLERTYLAAALTMRHRLAFVEESTVIHHHGYAFSVDASPACVTGRADAIRELQRLPWPRGLRWHIGEKLRAAEHHAAEFHLAGRAYAEAWRGHLRSMAGLDGLRYLPFTRFLLMPGLHRRRAAIEALASTARN